MPKNIQNIVAKIGEYTDSSNTVKAEWLTVGRLITHDDSKQQIFLDAIPTNFDGALYVFDRTKRSES